MEEIGLCPQGEKSGNAEKLAEYICSSKYLKSTYIKLMYLISYIYTQVYAEAEQVCVIFYLWIQILGIPEVALKGHKECFEIPIQDINSADISDSAVGY